ncbi:MAG: COG1470 family protein, partial [Planctomycetota bacterium]
ADRQIDLWGRATPLERDAHGRQVVKLSAMPVLVNNVDRSLMDLRTSISLTPDRVESGTELVRHTLEIANRGTRGLTGSVTLDGPREGWKITPHTLTFSVMPQQSALQDLEVHYPHNEPAGTHSILAKTTLTGESYYLEVPLPVELGLKDVDVWGMATVEGPNLVLRHVVTNRSEELLHFRGAADVPGRERQYRPLSGLRPRDTQTVEYRFARGVNLTGVKVRLGLREMNDGPRTHTLELVAP